ncbi:MAG: hypothetical protein ACPGRP_06280 [Flavobacteriaceae bacterium]
MRKRKLTSINDDVSVEVMCRGCKKRYQDGKLPQKAMLETVVTSRSLTLHLKSKNNCSCAVLHNNCLYNVNCYNFKSCVTATSLHQLPPSSPSKFTVEQFGLTMTNNCPSVCSSLSTKAITSQTQNFSTTKQRMHKVLNKQTVHQGLQPSISRKTIITELNKNRKQPSSLVQKKTPLYAINECILSDDDICQNLSFEPTESIHPTDSVRNREDHLPLSQEAIDLSGSVTNWEDHEPISKEDLPIKISSDVFGYKDLPTNLQVETELMQLMICHKMPLVCFKEIFKWAMRSQSKVDFDFAPLSHPRSRKTVINDLKKHLPEADSLKDFHCCLVNWLPEKKTCGGVCLPFQRCSVITDSE